MRIIDIQVLAVGLFTLAGFVLVHWLALQQQGH